MHTNEDPRLATRDKIIAAGAGLVAKRGAGGITPDDVCREAGVTRGQFREHFTDTTAVLAGVCAVAPGAVSESPMDRALRQLDNVDALRAWAEAYVEQLERNDFRDGCILSTLAGLLAVADPAARADVGTGLARWVTELAGSLRAMRDRGELRPEADPDALASSLLATLLGGTLLAKTMRDVAPLRSAIAGVMARVQLPATVQEAERARPSSGSQAYGAAPGW
jgi:TetR/AcrR family transcriptional regulator, transcriptional repressor for nem operon